MYDNFTCMFITIVGNPRVILIGSKPMVYDDDLSQSEMGISWVYMLLGYLVKVLHDKHSI